MMKQKIQKKIIKSLVWYFIVVAMITFLCYVPVEAKTKEVTGTRIINLKQKINGKEYYVGCAIDECDIHKGDIKYSEKPCSSGSDLQNIYVRKENKNKEIEWKTLRELKFTSMQGGCINPKKNVLLLAFVDKGKNKKGDLTALVEIDIKKNEVARVNIVKGASELNIDTLGHSNDFTYLNKRYYGAWYQENGKEDYSNRVGTIKDGLKGKGKVGELHNEKGAAVFGISVFDKKKEMFAMGIRKKVEGKLERSIATYKLKEGRKENKYLKQDKLITLKKNNDYNVPQCMEIHNKKIYLIKYFNKGKNTGKKIEKKVKYKNNIVEVYDFKGKLKKEYIIKNPVKTYYSKMYTTNNKIEYVKEDESLKQYKWEIESLIHYKKNTFYYTMYKPSGKKIGKQAYLYKVNLK